MAKKLVPHSPTLTFLRLAKTSMFHPLVASSYMSEWSLRRWPILFDVSRGHNLLLWHNGIVCQPLMLQSSANHSISCSAELIHQAMVRPNDEIRCAHCLQTTVPSCRVVVDLRQKYSLSVRFAQQVDVVHKIIPLAPKCQNCREDCRTKAHWILVFPVCIGKLNV